MISVTMKGFPSFGRSLCERREAENIHEDIFATRGRTHIFAKAILLQQALHESALHGREQVLRVKVAEARPVGEERFCLVSDGGGGVGELQQGQVGLFNALENGHVLPLRTQHPAPEQVELTGGRKRQEGNERRGESTSELLPSDKTVVVVVGGGQWGGAPKMKTAERSNTQ